LPWAGLAAGGDSVDREANGGCRALAARRSDLFLLDDVLTKALDVSPADQRIGSVA
jgi:hypothetical protein